MNSRKKRDLERAVCLGALSLSVFLGSLTTPSATGLFQPESANAQTQPATPHEWKEVEQAMGKAGAMQPGNVFKFSFLRSDLKVTAEGVQIKPALGLGSWVAFKPMGKEAMVMGDLVLTSDEVTSVMTRLQQSGIEQTALHNHINAFPPVLYMHIGGQGSPAEMAKAIRAALALSKTPLTAPVQNPAQSENLDIDTKELDQIMGYKGKVNGGVYQFSVPRAEKIMDNGMEVPPSMGTAHALNFQPTGGGRAAITGDFVLTANEVNPVIRALRENGVEVTALHTHMLTEKPRLFYMHFWANDDAVKLARGLRAALEKTNLARASVKHS